MDQSRDEPHPPPVPQPRSGVRCTFCLRIVSGRTAACQYVSNDSRWLPRNFQGTPSSRRASLDHGARPNAKRTWRSPCKLSSGDQLDLPPREQQARGGREHRRRRCPAQHVEAQAVDAIAHDLLVVGDEHDDQQQRRRQETVQDCRPEERGPLTRPLLSVAATNLVAPTVIEPRRAQAGSAEERQPWRGRTLSSQ